MVTISAIDHCIFVFYSCSYRGLLNSSPRGWRPSHTEDFKFQQFPVQVREPLTNMFFSLLYLVVIWHYL